MFSLLSTLALIAMTVFQAQAALPRHCDRTYKVTQGDTCDSICAHNNVSTFQLLHVNPWINSGCTNLVEETICLSVAGQDCTTTDVVQSGDTCFAIASEFNISLSTLFHNNPNVNAGCTNLFHPEVLCVSSTIYPYNVTQATS